MIFKRTRTVYNLTTNAIDDHLDHAIQNQQVKSAYRVQRLTDDLYAKAEDYQKDALTSRIKADKIRHNNPLLCEVIDSILKPKDKPATKVKGKVKG